jgi:hypothetical protein
MAINRVRRDWNGGVAFGLYSAFQSFKHLQP